MMFAASATPTAANVQIAATIMPIFFVTLFIFIVIVSPLIYSLLGIYSIIVSFCTCKIRGASVYKMSI